MKRMMILYRLNQLTLQRRCRVHFNTNVNKFKSIAYGYSNQITILSNENIDVISITPRKQQFSNTPISIVLVYISLIALLSVFIDFLRYLVGRSIDIFQEFFNTDGCEKVRSLNEVFYNYNLKVSEPTHLDGSLLYHAKSASHLKITNM